MRRHALRPTPLNHVIIVNERLLRYVLSSASVRRCAGVRGAAAGIAAAGRRQPTTPFVALLLAGLALIFACSSDSTEQSGGAYLIAYTTVAPAATLGDDRGRFVELWVRDLRAGEDTRLVAAEDGFTRIGQPQWAPSGESITFVGDSGIRVDRAPALYRVSLEGILTGIEVAGRQPFVFHAWAPDGETFAVITTSDARDTAVTIVSSKGEPQVLRAESIWFGWSSDGTLYYEDLRIEGDGARGNLYAVRDGTEEPISIAGMADYDHRLRGVTSDRRVLIFAVRTSSAAGSCHWVRAVTTSGESLWITPGEEASVSPARDLVVITDGAPLISPCKDDPLLEVAGTLIASPGPPSGVVVFDADANVVARFAYPRDGHSNLGPSLRSLGSSGAPVWDPEGTQFLLQAREDDDTNVIWLADLASGDLREIHRSQPGRPPADDQWIALAFGP